MAAAAVADAEIDKPIENAAGGEWAIGPDDWSLDAEGAAKLEALRRELGDLALPPALQGVALQRFLRASKFDVAVAAARMRATKKWREENRVDSLLQRRPLRLQQLIKPLVPEEFFGFDKWGRPAYFAKVGHFRAGLLAQLVTEEQFLQYHLWGMEESLRRAEEKRRELGKEGLRFANVIDLQGLSLDIRHFLKFMKVISAVDERHYPEMMGSTFVINAPSLFPTIWRVTKPLLDPFTVKKIRVLGADYREALLSNWDADQLPREYGGTADFAVRVADDAAIRELESRRRERVGDGLELKRAQITAGKVHHEDVVVEVGDAGRGHVVLEYFFSASSDVQFHAELLGADAEGKEAAAETLLERRVVDAHKVPGWGEVEVWRSGTVRFVWGNTHSLWTSKDISFAVRRVDPRGPRE